jgi:hypothetical protein
MPAIDEIRILSPTGVADRDFSKPRSKKRSRGSVISLAATEAQRIRAQAISEAATRPFHVGRQARPAHHAQSRSQTKHSVNGRRRELRFS